MSSPVETYIDNLSSTAAARQPKARARAHGMFRKLRGRTNILITTHAHPDPDAIGSCLGVQKLILSQMPAAQTTVRFAGRQSARFQATAEVLGLKFEMWDNAAVSGYDAIVLVDTQSTFAVCPLPPGVLPTVVIDHHRGRGRRPEVPFADIRPDVGSASAIVFSYFAEMNVPIDPLTGAALLYGIEADTAGAAGHQSPLDTVAISGLVLVADIRKLWQMRYVKLPANYYVAFSQAVQAAERFDKVLITYAGVVDLPEEPALLADALQRLEGTDCALVMAYHDGRLVLSLRNTPAMPSAGELMRRLVKSIGEGGGHRTKSGGQIKLDAPAPDCINRLTTIIRRRLLRSLHIKPKSGIRLAP